MDLQANMSHKDFDPLDFLKHAFKQSTVTVDASSKTDEHLRLANSLLFRLQVINSESTANLGHSTKQVVSEVAH